MLQEELERGRTDHQRANEQHQAILSAKNETIRDLQKRNEMLESENRALKQVDKTNAYMRWSVTVVDR